MNELELTGRACTHIEQIEDSSVAVHREVVEPFLALRDAATEEGLDVVALSSFRDFGHQLNIWNRKFRGELPLFSRDGTLRDPTGMSEDEIVEAILVWSALPGASRHHWGTDIDVYDRRAHDPRRRVELLREHYRSGGAYARLVAWMDEHLHRFGFVRPYDSDRGGVALEPWHISYAAVSGRAQAALRIDMVARALEPADMLGKRPVLERLPDIFRRFVLPQLPIDRR
jgi:LAS superfamily LD-carboxypeptidase LdcB